MFIDFPYHMFNLDFDSFFIILSIGKLAGQGAQLRECQH